MLNIVILNAVYDRLGEDSVYSGPWLSFYSFIFLILKELEMSKKYTDITRNISSQMAKMRKEMPEVMSAFANLSQAATKEGALDKKTKELIAIALAVANHCPGCLGFHAQTLVKLGVSREELMDTLGMAVYMGGGPSLMYAADALDAFEEFNE